MRVFLIVFGGGVGLLFFLPLIYSRISATLFAPVGLFTGLELWLGFAIFAVNCNIHSAY